MRHNTLRRQVHAWLWHGYLRRGEITLLTGPYQSGKTTLACALLRQLETGGVFLGHPLPPGHAWLFTPDPLVRWQLRHREIPLGDHVTIITHAGHGHPSEDDWQSLADQATSASLDLLIVHHLERFYPHSREPDLQLALVRLRNFAAGGGTVLILDGPLDRKSAAYRQSLLAGVDAALTYSRAPSEKSSSPLRLLRSATPRRETPARLASAWHPATARLEPAEDHPVQKFKQQWLSLEKILKQSPTGATFTDLWTRWPPETPKPSRATFYRLLDRAGLEQRITQEGHGTNVAPRRWRLMEGVANES